MRFLEELAPRHPHQPSPKHSRINNPLPTLLGARTHLLQGWMQEGRPLIEGAQQQGREPGVTGKRKVVATRGIAKRKALPRGGKGEETSLPCSPPITATRRCDWLLALLP